MFKDYIVIDNVLSESQIENLLSLSKKIGYYSNELPEDNGIQILKDSLKPRGAWRGYRSGSLEQIDHDLWVSIFKHLIATIFGVRSFGFNIKSFLHMLPGNIIHDDRFWHTDDYELFAGVLYLNETPDSKSGTLLKVNGEIVNIENKFNRLVFYKASLTHMPAGWHGSKIEDMRMSLNFFISELEFLAAQDIKRNSENNTWLI